MFKLSYICQVMAMANDEKATVNYMQLYLEIFEHFNFALTNSHLFQQELMPAVHVILV